VGESPALERQAVSRAEVRETLARLPDRPGVYIMRNRVGEIIYVGKSCCLKHRVRSYFNSKRQDPKTGVLAQAVTAIEVIVTTSEAEALILENNLIKRHKPRYNIRLKDCKTHPYLKVALDEPFPRLLKVRKVKFRDGNLYFGPFPNEYDIRRIADLLSQAFRLCTGKLPINPNRPPARPCLKYHLGKCLGACVGTVAPEVYRAAVDQVVAILQGKSHPDFAEMERRMETMAAEFRFEEAAQMRDTITAFQAFFASQKVEFMHRVDTDFWGTADSPDRLVNSVFFVRGGKLLGQRVIDSEREPGASVAELLGTVMTRFYDVNLIPPRISSSIKPKPVGALKEFLTRQAGRPVRLGSPRGGKFRRLLQMADSNALEVLRNIKTDQAQVGERIAESVVDLERQLGLAAPPVRFECVDISHTMGVDPVASLVTFENGKPRRAGYRLFHLRSAGGGDDPAAIAEVTRRRFTRLLAQHEPLPDLFLVDGGITQTRAARAELDALGLTVPVWGLAKREELLVPVEGEPVKLPHTAPALRLVVAARNEAHRFANSFQAKLRGKRMVRSALLTLPGIGPRTIQKIVTACGSLARAARLTPEELGKLAGITLDRARLIISTLAARDANSR
jgi:excinuclease ABC subunit C